MQRDSFWNFVGINSEGSIRKVWPTEQAVITTKNGNVEEVQTRLRISEIDVMRRQQPVPLRPDITNLQFHVIRQLLLNREVVLRRILAAHVRLELSEQEVGTEHSPVHRLIPWRIQDTVHTGKRRQAERIGVGERPALILKRSVEPRVEGECAST